MDRKLYQEMAALIGARIACYKSDDKHEWYLKHTERLEKLLDFLPHGSGLDYTWHYDYNKSHSDKIVLTMSYHAMDENGFYSGIIDFTVKVTPSLQSGFNLLITGNFNEYQDVKDYLYDILYDAFDSVVEIVCK